MSDDMLLTREHSPADIYSPLFGAAISFKSNGYSTTSPPTEVDARRFGEKVRANIFLSTGAKLN